MAMFATAKKLNTKPDAKKRDTKQRFEVEGLLELTYLDVVKKNVASLEKTVKGGVNLVNKELFMGEKMYTAGSIAKAIGGRVVGNKDCEISAVCSPESVKSGSVVLIRDARVYAGHWDPAQS